MIPKLIQIPPPGSEGNSPSSTEVRFGRRLFRRDGELHPSWTNQASAIHNATTEKVCSARSVSVRRVSFLKISRRQFVRRLSLNPLQ